jgi:hypothetical protein
LLALAQEVLLRLALQALGVGLLRTFDRPRGPLGRVLLATGRVSATSLTVATESPPADEASTVPAVVICVSAPEVKSFSEGVRQNAPAQTSDTIRICKERPADGRWLISGLGAGYKSRIRNFKHSALCCAAAMLYFLDNAIVFLNTCRSPAPHRIDQIAHLFGCNRAGGAYAAMQKKLCCAKKTLILC